MRRKGHPSFPSAMTCCFFSSLKTLLMPTEPIRAPVGVNVPGLPMAGFQLTLHGRIWVTTEDEISKLSQIPATCFLLLSLSFAEFLALLLTICVTFSKQSDTKKGGGKNRHPERIEEKRKRLAPRARFELATLRLTGSSSIHKSLFNR